MTTAVYCEATVAMQEQAVTVLDELQDRVDSQIDSQRTQGYDGETGKALSCLS